jgi:hypothetical protein
VEGEDDEARAEKDEREGHEEKVRHLGEKEASEQRKGGWDGGGRWVLLLKTRPQPAELSAHTSHVIGVTPAS